MNKILTVLLLIFILFVTCDNQILDRTLPDRNGKVDGTDSFTIKLVHHNQGAGDSVSFSHLGSLTEIIAQNGDNIEIHYSLSNIQITNELVLSFGPAKGTATIKTPGSASYIYIVNPGDAVNGIITITADFIHTNLIPLNPPTNVHFNKDGVISFTPGLNNAAAGCTYTYTLYRDDIAVILDQPFTVNASDPILIYEMLSCDGFYTVKVKANTINPSYTSESIESAHSEVVSVYAVTITIIGASSSEKVTVHANGETKDYSFPLYYFSGTNITLTATPSAGRRAVWSGIPGSGNTRTIDSIWSNNYITVSFTTPVLSLNAPSEVTYSSNYNNRNALTPLSGEHTATFTISVGGFAVNSDAYNVELTFTTVPGLTVSGHNIKADAVNGTKTFTIHVTYNGTTAFTDIINSASINIHINTSTIPAGYTQSGTSSYSRSINVIDGQHPSRPIPVNQSNVTMFRAYAVSAQGNAGKNYKQVENINHSWTTITGTFNSGYDGGGFTVSNFTGNNGLFTTIGVNGVVQNLGVSGSINSTGNSVGGIAGTNQGRIINCHSNATVNGNQNVGGIVGNNNNNGFVKNCFNTGNVSGNTYVGGIVGYNNHTARVEECYNTGTITGGTSATTTQWWGIGGVVGEIVTANGVVTNCYNTGNVFGNDHTGGVVGTSRGEVSNCYNTGYVSYLTTEHRTSSGGSGHGGVLGNHYLATGSVKDSVSLGLEVNGNSNNNGRVVGYIANNSYIINLKARANMLVGSQGVLNTVTGTASNSIHGADIALGTPLSGVFSGWDTSIWNIPGGNLVLGGALPTLRNMPGGTQNPTLP